MPELGSQEHATRHPLREPVFRALWSANLTSNVGVWMQTVGGAVGPAIGGLVVAVSGPAATFLLNAASFLAALTVVSRWRPPARRRAWNPSNNERFARTILTGLQSIALTLAATGLAVGLFAAARWPVEDQTL